MPEQTEPRRGREGGRWINERPTSEEFGIWFTENMKIDAKLDAKDYVGGVVLIPAVDERAKQVTGFTAKGAPIIEQGSELSYIPYAKVETRITYYWDLLDAHPEWVGVVEPIDLARVSIEPQLVKETTGEDGVTLATEYAKPGGLAGMVHQLPSGFSVMSVPVGEGYSHFLCCTTRVSIYDREEWKALTPDERKELAHTGIGAVRSGRGTKQVPMVLGRQQVYADTNSLMKAETGALGRALGFAGIFVIPGSGVATAEDVQEALLAGQQGAGAATTEGNAGPETPPQEPAAPRTGAEETQDEQAQLMESAKTLWKTLSEHHPEAAAEFGKWAKTRNLTSLSDARGAMLKGTVKKLEKLVDEAEGRTQQQPVAPDPRETPTFTDPTPEERVDVPAEATPEPSGPAEGSA